MPTQKFDSTRCANCVSPPSVCQWGKGPYPGVLLLYMQVFHKTFFFENHILILMSITIILAGDCCECDSHKGGVGNNAWRPL